MSLNTKRDVHFNLGKLFILERLLDHPLVTNEIIFDCVNTTTTKDAFRFIIRDGMEHYYRSNHQFKIDDLISSIQLQIDNISKKSQNTQNTQNTQTQPTVEKDFKAQVLDIREIMSKILIYLDIKSLTRCKLINLQFLIDATEQRASISHINVSDLCALYEREYDDTTDVLFNNHRRGTFDFSTMKNVKSIRFDKCWPSKHNRYLRQLGLLKNLKHITFDMKNYHKNNYFHNSSHLKTIVETMILSNMTVDNDNIESLTVNTPLWTEYVENNTNSKEMDQFKDFYQSETVVTESEALAKMYENGIFEQVVKNILTRQRSGTENDDSKFQSKFNHFIVNIKEVPPQGYTKNMVMSWLGLLDIDLVTINVIHTRDRKGAGLTEETAKLYDEIKQLIGEMQVESSTNEYRMKKVEIYVTGRTTSLKKFNDIMKITLDMGNIVKAIAGDGDSIHIANTAAIKTVGPRININNVLQHIIDDDENRCKKWHNISLDLEKSKALIKFMESVFEWYKMDKGYLSSQFKVIVVGNNAAIKVGDINWVQLLLNTFKHVFVNKQGIKIDQDCWDDIKGSYVEDVNYESTRILNIKNKVIVQLGKEQMKASWKLDPQNALSIQISVF